jgi:hypothetical protein
MGCRHPRSPGRVVCGRIPSWVTTALRPPNTVVRQQRAGRARSGKGNGSCGITRVLAASPARAGSGERGAAAEEAAAGCGTRRSGAAWSLWAPSPWRRRSRRARALESTILRTRTRTSRPRSRGWRPRSPRRRCTCSWAAIAAQGTQPTRSWRLLGQPHAPDRRCSRGRGSRGRRDADRRDLGPRDRPRHADGDGRARESARQEETESALDAGRLRPGKRPLRDQPRGARPTARSSPAARPCPAGRRGATPTTASRSPS